MDTVIDLVAHLATVHGACWRRIAVTVDADGKKTPRGERNNLTQQQIAADPGSGGWASVALKHCENLVVVDFDTHALDGCKLHEFCVQLDTARTETRKGEHHYIYITGIPDDIGSVLTGSRQQKLCAQPQYDVDLLKGNNVWEPMDRAVSGELRTVLWRDVAQYFSLPTTDTQPPPKRARDNSGSARPAAASGTPSAQLPGGATEWLRGNGLPVTKVYNIGERVCAHVDCDCPFAGRRHRSNNCYIVVQPHNLVLRCHDADCEGRQQVLDWSPPRAEPPPTDAAAKDASASAPVRELFEESYDAHDPSAMIDAINQVVCFIDGCKGGKSVFIIEEPGCDPVLKSRQTLLEYFEDEQFTVAVNGPRAAVRYETVDPIKLWLKDSRRRKHKEIDFNPRFVGHTRKMFNNWTGFAITPDAAAAWAAENDWEAAVQPFTDHILTIWCKGVDAHFEYVLNWYAWILQFPWDKTRTSISVKSRLEGVGKTLVDEKFGEILGDWYLEVSDENQVLGNFTSSLANKLLVVMDEAVFGGDKKAHGKLLSTITGAKQKIECKGVDAIFVDSYINVRQNSNKEFFAYTQDGSRRPFMLEASNALGSIMTPETTAYFTKIAATPPEALAHMLYTRDLSGTNIRQFPQTELYRDQVIRSLPAFRAFWYTVFSRGFIVPERTEGHGDFATTISAIGWEDDGNPPGQRVSVPLTVDKATVYDAFRAEVRGQSYIDSSSVFWQNSKRLFDDTPFYTDQRTQANGQRAYTVTLPPLPTCIERWNGASSVNIQ